MRALILAAGYATRLWPLTINKPKPLLLVTKRPIIDYIIDKIKGVEGVNEIFIITNSRFVRDFKKWQELCSHADKISIIDDRVSNLHRRRGSIGDIIFAIEERKVDSDIIVIAGDNIFSSKIDDFVKEAKNYSPSLTVGLYDVKDKTLARRYGIVELNSDARIISFEEKPNNPRSTLAAMCLYYFPNEKLDMLKRYCQEGHSLDMAGYFIKWLSEREAVYGYIFGGSWLDIGDKVSLKMAQTISWV